MRKVSEHMIVEDDVLSIEGIQKHQRRTNTLKGNRLLRAAEVSYKLVQYNCWSQTAPLYSRGIIFHLEITG